MMSMTWAVAIFHSTSPFDLKKPAESGSTGKYRLLRFYPMHFAYLIRGSLLIRVHTHFYNQISLTESTCPETFSWG